MFLDTSGLFCVYSRTEPFHVEALRLFSADRPMVTHNYVLSEFIALAHTRRAPRLGTLSFAFDLKRNPLIEIVHVVPWLHEQAMNLLVQRLDKDWSLCDAVSFLLMDSRGLLSALTTDHHFEQAGFVQLLKP